MNTYLVFTDEAGTYRQKPSESHIRRHPYYIRSYVLISIEDYQLYQIEMQRLNDEYEIPWGEEIKWSDCWNKIKGKPRREFISKMSPNKIKKYYRQAMELAVAKESVRFMYTVTDIVGKTCSLKNDDVFRFHFQDAFQRVQMDLKAERGFAIFVMDDLNKEVIQQIKLACHTITVHGDFVNYKNIYQGVLAENSIYSPGIQLADYAAGAMNGFLRGKLIAPGQFKFATVLFDEYIKPYFRSHNSGCVVGYSVIDIPKRKRFRDQLINVFN